MKLPIARRSALDARVRELEEARNERNRLERELELHQEARKLAEINTFAARGDIARLQATLARVQSACSALEDVRARLDSEKVGLMEQLAELAELNAEATHAHQETKTRLADLNRAHNVLQSERDRLTVEARAHEIERAQMNARGDVLAGELELARVEIARMAQRLGDFEAEITRLGRETIRLEDHNRRLQHDLANALRGTELAQRTAEDLKSEVKRLGDVSLQLEWEKRTLETCTVPAASHAALQNELKALRPTGVLQTTISNLRETGARARLADALSLDHNMSAPARKAVFTLHKTASSFIWHLLDFLSDVLNIPVYSPNGTGNSYIPDEINIRHSLAELESRFGLFGAFRGYIDCKLDMFDRLIVTLRDPRDILTSLFYSWTYSHPIDAERLSLVNSRGELFNPSPAERAKWATEGIDTFVLEYARFVEANCRLYVERLLPRPNCTVLFYEDFISEPGSWISQFLAAFGADPNDIDILLPHVLARFQADFEVLPEDKSRHQRQMLPGDHRRKLQESTIDALTARFAFYFAATGKTP